jgi:uncharacterized protein YndB with AHSA1/START domain
VVAVPFPVPREVAFDYLVDPGNRAQWQSSLARVEDVDGEPRVGQTWVDVTRAGVRPRMVTTELDRPRRWTERGSWRGLAATLTLDLAETGTGCDVTATVVLTGRGLAAPVALALGVLAPYAVRGDLRHAASRLLA